MINNLANWGGGWGWGDSSNIYESKMEKINSLPKNITRSCNRKKEKCRPHEKLKNVVNNRTTVDH